MLPSWFYYNSQGGEATQRIEPSLRAQFAKRSSLKAPFNYLVIGYWLLVIGY